MPKLKLLRGLGPIDARSVSRDALLRALFVLPLVVAVACRLVLPMLLGRVGELVGSDLLVYYPAVAGSVLTLVAPAMAGTVIGFLLLDQRDDRTLTALQVTPLPLAAYLTYRLAAPMAISFAMTLVAFVVAGLPGMGVGVIVPAAIVAAPLAPLAALGLAAFASNKVQGFALMKGASVLLVAPLLGLLVPMPWRLALGLVPTCWPVWLLWALRDGAPHAAWYALGGVAYLALLIWLLLRRFKRVMYQ